MFTKLDDQAKSLLRCPNCKAPLEIGDAAARCTECAQQYPHRAVDTGAGAEMMVDLRIAPPAFCIPASMKEWHEGQVEFERLAGLWAQEDSLETYQAEAEGVRTIYQQLPITGAVLDVGGHQGRLRRHLDPSKVTLYVSVDPFATVFQGIAKQKNLLTTFPELNHPCNFVLGRAEELPFASKSFDWVHMRSVVDHFVDPYRALREARRVLNASGKLMIGLAIHEKMQAPAAPPHRSFVQKVKDKIAKEGPLGVVTAAARKAKHLMSKPELEEEEDHHMFHFTEAELRTLVESAGFRITAEKWQDPPHYYCLYLVATVA